MADFAFVFPGQGSQSVGMMDAWDDHAVVRETLQEASDALREDLAELIHSGPEDALSLTTNTQPAMLAANVACWRAWRAQGGAMPAAMAGHSLGEFAALVAAESLDLADAVRLVRLRATAMQEAVPVGQGAMAAIIGLESERIAELCDQTTRELGGAETVEAVNFNTPVQTVIAGSKIAVEQACARLKEAGAKRALVLPVSAPFHSRLMKPAAERLRIAMDEIPFRAPVVPVVNNVDVATPDDPELIRDALYRQAFGPVHWVETIRALVQMGVSSVVECGPGKVLSGMNARIDRSLASLSVRNPATLSETASALG